MRANSPTVDPRRRRTRDTLLSAFVALALRRRYHAIRIDDIVTEADVGRSTFYEHFASKDALLVASMDPALSLLAGAPTGASTRQEIAALLAHFRDNRVLALTLFQGTALRVVRNALVDRVEARLARHATGRLALPPRLVAHALADGLLSPILAWLAGEASCDAAELAAGLEASSTATLAGLLRARG